MIWEGHGPAIGGNPRNASVNKQRQLSPLYITRRSPHAWFIVGVISPRLVSVLDLFFPYSLQVTFFSLSLDCLPWLRESIVPSNNVLLKQPADMLPSQLNSSPKRANPFGRSSPSPAPQSQPRPKSAIISPSHGLESARGHLRNASVSQLTPNQSPASISRQRSNSVRNNASSGTFAPSFIKSEELRRGADQIRGLEGDNDFSGNKYVWLRDAEKAFVRGLVLEELEGGSLLVQTDDGEVGAVSTLRGPRAGLTSSTAARSGCRPG